jgi:site-specific recombinase XerD
MPLRNQFGSRVPPSGDPPDHRIESFVERLRMAGYAPESIRLKRLIASAYILWARRRNLSIEECEESHVVAFLRRRERRSRDRVIDERATVRLFLRHIRGQEGVHHTPLRFDSALGGDLERRYLDYLLNERGLARNSILVYMQYVRDLLSAFRSGKRSAEPKLLNAQWLQQFMLGRLRGRSSEWSRLLSVALRSFLRFLYFRGETSIDLSHSVPTVRKWRQASVPQYLTAREVAQVLSATSRPTATGRRDYAILLLLARLGLRAGEVVLLELGDIRWRSGEIVVRGKGGMRDRLPLLPDVGRVLAAYLSKGRPRVASRRVLLPVKNRSILLF